MMGYKFILRENFQKEYFLMILRKLYVHKCKGGWREAQ